FNEARDEALFGPFVSLKKVQSIIDPPNTIRSEYSSYDNNVSAYEFLEAISFVIEESLTIVSKHLLDNYPVVRFLSIIQLDDAAVQPIVDNINLFLMAKKININNIYYIGSDGASTMLEKNNGVATIFKKENPFLLEHYCIAHRLALVAKDAAEKILYLKDYNSIVNNLYSYFSSSYKRMINLQLVEQTLDEPNLVYTHLKATIDTITTQYIGRNGMPPNYGNFLKEYINEQGILFEELPDFISQFAIATIESLQDRFSDSEILNSLRIFDLRELPLQYNQIHSYGNNEIQTLVNFYGKPKNFHQIEYQLIIDSNLLIKEWDIFKYQLLNYWTTTTIYVWKAFFDLPNFFMQFSNITKLASIFLITPLSNAIVERVFSYQNLIKTKSRNQLNVSTLHMLLLIALNGPESEIFEWEKAYNYWMTKDRHI
ncbi:30799_t:CDS:2, partial [Gigaspora margarita]